MPHLHHRDATGKRAVVFSHAIAHLARKSTSASIAGSHSVAAVGVAERIEYRGAACFGDVDVCDSLGQLARLLRHTAWIHAVYFGGIP